MGVTIHYQATLDRLDEIELFEDAVVAAVVAIGGKPTIWRSHADKDASRMVRGVMAEIGEGVETLSLLVSPEGHLTPLHRIREAEEEKQAEPPYCWIKTQFGTPFDHVAVIYLLRSIRDRFASNMTISDEGCFDETDDFQELVRRMGFLRSAISSLRDALSQTSLTAEAAEDPAIVALRVERIARVIQQKMASCQTDSPVRSRESEGDDGEDLQNAVDRYASMWSDNEARLEEMTRRISESMAIGKSSSEAIRDALDEQVVARHEGRDAEDDEAGLAEESSSTGSSEFEVEYEQPWQPSETELDDARSLLNQKHASIELAEQLLELLMQSRPEQYESSSFYQAAVSAALECVGALAQATSATRRDTESRALAIVQLRRALRSHATVRGAVFAMSRMASIDQPAATRLHDHLQRVLDSIHALLAEAWGESD